MLITVIVAVAYVAGAFSHKWAAAVFAKETGQDAQAIADKAKAAAASVAKKV